MRKTAFWMLAFAVAAAATMALASSTARCQDKRAWQQRIVERIVQRWLDGQPRALDLADLIQAEQGRVACSAGSEFPTRLHTPQLPRYLELDQLGSVLLAHELEWRFLLPPPEAGLIGVSFKVRSRAPTSEDAR